MPIRWRLTLWFALILCLILVLSGTALHILLQRDLIREMDNNLQIYTARIHGNLSTDDIPPSFDYNVIHAKLPPINEFSSPGIYIQIIDKNSEVVVKSDNLGEQELPVDPRLIDKGFAGNVAIDTVAAGESVHVRIMVSPLYLKDQTLLLEVAQSLKHVDAAMSRVRWALLASIPLALVLAGASGGFLVRRALAPVQRITRTARGIQNGADLSRRVGYRGPSDEIGQLATTFDQMLQQLDRAFQLQKDFIADASHELRSPLTVILGNLDLLKRNLSEADRQECLKAINGETSRMTKIVGNLLALAEVEAGQIEHQETVSLKEVLLEGLRRAQQAAGNHQITIGRQEDLYIKGDAYRLKQLLDNLVDNAVRYTPEGGTITLSLFRDSGWARLEVADNGIGIPPEHLPHLFGRFYRVDKARSRAKGGSGLGLAIVKSIAEQHGGKVTVASEPGKGSTFTAWFPLNSSHPD